MTRQCCPDCGGRVASFTAGPMMQVRCLGDGECWQDKGCGARWQADEHNSGAWNHFTTDRRPIAPAQQERNAA